MAALPFELGDLLGNITVRCKLSVTSRNDFKELLLQDCEFSFSQPISVRLCSSSHALWCNKKLRRINGVKKGSILTNLLYIGPWHCSPVKPHGSSVSISMPQRLGRVSGSTACKQREGGQAGLRCGEGWRQSKC